MKAMMEMILTTMIGLSLLSETLAQTTCPEGQYALGGTTCTNCGIYSWAPEGDATSCTDCPEGTRTSAPGTGGRIGDCNS